MNQPRQVVAEEVIEGTGTVPGWKGRIGLISPDDGINDDEFWEYLPEGVTLLITRYTTPLRDDPIDPEMVSSYSDIALLEQAAHVLKVTRPAVVAFGCNSCSSVGGLGTDLAQAEAIGSICGVPGTTISTAQVAALRALRVSRVALGAPYVASVTKRLADFLEASGFAVLAMEALDLTTEWDIGGSPPSVWYDLARKVDTPDVEAVVLGCGGIRTAGILTELEADLGKPVVSAPAALIWHSLRLMDVDVTRGDRGLLFSRLGAVRVAGT